MKPALPPMNVEQITIESGKTDGLLPALAQSLSERLEARRDTVEARCQAAAELAKPTGRPVLSGAPATMRETLEDLITDAVQIAGSDRTDKDNE